MKKKQSKAKARAKPKSILQDLEQSESLEPLKIITPVAQAIQSVRDPTPKVNNETAQKQQAFSSAIQSMLLPREISYQPLQVIELRSDVEYFDRDHNNIAPQATHIDDEELIDINDIPEKQVAVDDEKINNLHEQSQISIMSMDEPHALNYPDRLQFGDIYSSEHILQQQKSLTEQLAYKCRSLSFLFKKLSRSINGMQRRINFQPFITLVIMVIVMSLYIWQVSNAVSITSPTSYDSLKRWIANHLVMGALIFTFYGIVFLHLHYKLAYIISFFVLGVPATFVFLYFLYETYVTRSQSEISEPGYIVSLYLVVMYYFWLIIALTRNDLLEVFGAKRMQIMMLFIFALLALLCYGIYWVTTLNQITNMWISDLVNVASAPYLAFICLLWVYFHFKFFSGFKTSTERYLATISSVTLGGTMITIVCLSLLYLGNLLSVRKTYYFDQRENTQTTKVTFDSPRFDNGASLYMILFFLLCVPAFTFLVTAILMNKIPYRLKIIFLPFFGALIPIFFTLPFSVMFDMTSTTQILLPLREFFIFGPSATSILLITLLFYQSLSTKINTISLSSCLCLTVLVPLIYIRSLQNTETFQSDEETTAASTLFTTLLLIGVAIAALVALKDAIIISINWMRKKRQHSQIKPVDISVSDDSGAQMISSTIEKQIQQSQNRFELTDIFRYDLEDFGIWGNSTGYIITLTVLAFTFYERPYWITLQQSGSLIGMQIVIILLFIICLVALRMRVVSFIAPKGESLMEKFALLIEELKIRKDLLIRQSRVARLIAHLGFLEIPALMIICVIAFQNNNQLTYNFLTIFLGAFIVAIIYLGFHYLKGSFEDQARTAIPVLVVFCWIFLFVPFGSIIPCAIFYLSIDKEEYVEWERLVTGSIIQLMLLAIALIIVIIHLFFKDFNQKFTFIASKIIKRLANNHVKADYYVLGLIYQIYNSKGTEECRRRMIEGDPCFWRPVPDYEPDPRFDKMMVNQRAINLLNVKPQSKTKCRSCLSKFVDLLFLLCCCQRNNIKIQDEMIDPNIVDSQDQELDFEQQLNKILIQAREEEVERQEEVEQQVQEEEEKDPWIKGYLQRLVFRPMPYDVLEAVRRYDTPVVIHISTPVQDLFWKNLFFYFGNGNPLNPKWLDYSSFKEIIRLSGITEDDIQEQQIDITYSKFIQKKVTLEDLPELFTDFALATWPMLEREDALGYLLRKWLIPNLVWNVPAFRYLYIHTWEYILFLLGHRGYEAEIDWAIDLDESTKRELEEQLGISPLSQSKLNPDYDLQYLGDPPFTFYELKEMFLLWWNEFMENLAYVCNRICKPDWSYLKKRKGYQVEEINEEGFEVKKVYKDEITIEKAEVLEKYLKLQAKIDITKQFHHEKSPDWSEIVDTTLDEIKIQEGNYMYQKTKQTQVKAIRRNFTNLFFVLFKLLETYSMASMAFRPEIDWGLKEPHMIGFFNTIGPKPNAYLTIFVICLIGSIVFMIAIYRGVVKAKTNHYGFSEGGLRPIRLTWDFFTVLYLLFSFYAGSYLLFKNMMDTFSCDYTVVPQVIYMTDDFYCLTEKHKQNMALGGLVFAYFYMTTSFLFPNTQINIRSLDYRFDPTYLILQIQFKMLAAGFAAFFVRESVILIQFVGTAVLMILLASLCSKTKPCYYDKWNSIEAGLYLVVAIFHLAAAINYYTQPLYGFYFILAGMGFVLVMTVAFYYQTAQIEAYQDQLHKDDKEDHDADASDDKKEKLEFVFWKGLCDLEEKYNQWIPEEMASREKVKEERRIQLQMEYQKLGLKEEF